MNVAELVRDHPTHVGDPRRDGDRRLTDWLQFVLHVSFFVSQGSGGRVFPRFRHHMAEFITILGGNNLPPGIHSSWHTLPQALERHLKRRSGAIYDANEKKEASSTAMDGFDVQYLG